jgi:hypothetical protein
MLMKAHKNKVAHMLLTAKAATEKLIDVLLKKAPEH